MLKVLGGIVMALGAGSVILAFMAVPGIASVVTALATSFAVFVSGSVVMTLGFIHEDVQAIRNLLVLDRDSAPPPAD